MDTSTYSVEERVLGITWAHERAHTGKTIKDVQRDFAARFNKEANETAMATETLHNWIRFGQLASTRCPLRSPCPMKCYPRGG
ncbi:hypothetical protein C0J52_22700 [Blattella germanica]|nr:hypothetical protein C0J52_22700 [Blattella germanica]